MSPQSSFAATIYPERPALVSDEQAKELVLASVVVAEKAAAEGNHPFGCVLVNENGKIVMEQGNLDTVNHAELTLARRAYAEYKPEQLWKMALVTNFEPCCMCSGAIYWSNIGTVIYGLPESTLLELTGTHPENPTMHQTCRETFTKGSKDIRVIGPLEDKEVEEKVLGSHKDFWQARGVELGA